MTRAYDIVIIDSAPLLGLADAPLLSKSVEGILYAIEANGLKLRNIETGLRRLQVVESPVFGAIVTKLSSRNLAYGYGEAYGYGYEYASKHDG
jgi:Mrp family chromosome partitioning ATPase